MSKMVYTPLSLYERYGWNLSLRPSTVQHLEDKTVKWKSAKSLANYALKS